MPKENLVGEENRGWYIGTTTLDYERSGIATGVSHALMVRDLVEYVHEHEHDPTCALDRDPTIRYQLVTGSGFCIDLPLMEHHPVDRAVR